MSTLDELRRLIEAGIIEIDEIEAAKEAYEAIDLLAPGGAIVINEATGEMRCWTPPEPRYFTAWDGQSVQLAMHPGLCQWYILDKYGKPRPTNDQRAAYRMLKDIKARKVAETRFRFRGYRVEVSTVFMTLDHSLIGRTPTLWETMIFTSCPDLNGYQARYTSRKEAEKGHRAAIVIARRVLHELTRHSGRRIKAELRAEESEAGNVV